MKCKKRNFKNLFIALFQHKLYSRCLYLSRRVLLSVPFSLQCFLFAIITLSLFLVRFSYSHCAYTSLIPFFPIPLSSTYIFHFFCLHISVCNKINARTHTHTPFLPISLCFVFCLDPWPCLRLSEDDSVTLKPYARTSFRVS